MIVDVLYSGLTLAKGANARASDEGGDALFVELESPMPVGTALVIRTPDGERAGRVAAVNEGNGPGVTVRFGAGAAKVVEEPHDAKNGESDDDEPSDPKKSSGAKRPKRRKTVMGH
jgi:hypothetical protein